MPISYEKCIQSANLQASSKLQQFQHYLKVQVHGWLWWYTPVIPAVWAAEIRGLLSKTSPDKNMRHYRNKLKQKGLGT
jgi:hypothetical protein